MMNVALVGCGTICEKTHLPILRSIPGLNIVAICDNNEKRVSRVADIFKIKRRYSEIDDMLESVDIDFLDLATPGFTHFEIAKKVIGHDVNLLVEKPVTLKATEAEYLETEAKKRNLKLGVFQNYRYKEPVIEFQNVRDRGGIGTIEKITTIAAGSGIFAMPPWFWDENVSGGILFELGVHAVDLQCYLMGPAKEVLSVSINYEKTLDFTTAILTIVKFQYGIGVIDLNWLSSSSFFHQYISGSVSNAIIKFFPDSFVLQQSDMTPLSECIGEVKRAWNFSRMIFTKKFSEMSRVPHRMIIENFINSINTDDKLLIPISTVIPTIRLLEEIWSKVLVEKKEVID